MKILVTTFILLICMISCSAQQGTFVSKQLKSSKGEILYINSINWGVTDDNQLTVITKNKNELKAVEDTLGAVYGLQPFIYKFKDDTFNLYFINRISYKVSAVFETIKIKYSILSPEEYNKLFQQTLESSDYS